ncbi:MAG: hypothetical protein H6621_12430 [Halobacteriovoraceae bacterium]|nr:hypothetical protein [Halobacteriovoraceae bacterium]
MKLTSLLFSLFIAVLHTSYANDIVFCRHLDEPIKFIELNCEPQGDCKITAGIDDSLLGSSAEPTIIETRNIFEEAEGLYSGYRLEFKLYEEEIEGYEEEIFLGELTKGILRSFNGEYSCIRNGYLELEVRIDAVSYIIIPQKY